jgi:GTPase SAR1 family protein
MVPLNKFLKPYREAGAYNALLAPHRFLDANVFLTKGNALGVALSVEGIDPECLTEAMLDTYTRRAAAAWRSFDEHLRVYQYIVKQVQTEIPEQAEYPTATVTDTVRNRNEYLRTKGLYTVRLVYVFLLEGTALPRSVRRALSNKKVLRLLSFQVAERRAQLMAVVDSFRRNLDDLLGLKLLSKANVFAFFRLLANLDPELAASERFKHDSHLDYYLPSAALQCTPKGLSIGDVELEVLSLKEPPGATFPNLLGELLSIESNFILCSEFQRALQDKAVSTVRAAQTHFHWSQWVSDIPSIISMAFSRGNRENVVADESATDDVKDLGETLKRLNAGTGREYLGQYSLTIVLFGSRGRAPLKTAAADVAKIVGNHEGALIHETYNALNAYLAIIPGNSAFNLRRVWLLSGNYADLSFLYAPYPGELRNRHLKSEYTVALETNDRTLAYLALHEGDKQGLLVFGAQRVGKSTLANLLIDHSQKTLPRTFIVDLGGSYEFLTRKHGGSYVKIRFGREQTFRINPFVLPGTEENLQFLAEFVGLLIVNNEGTKPPSVREKQELYEVIEEMYLLDEKDRTLKNLADGLPQRLKDALVPWVRGGQYGTVFDNDEDTLSFAHFQTFDFQGMDQLYPQLLGPFFFYIFQRISQMVYDPTCRTIPKQLWADEVWRFLTNDTARDYFIEAGKTWPKHNGGIALITQSAADLQLNGVLAQANELCPTKLLLPNPGADFADYKEIFHLNERETELFAALAPKRQVLWKTETHAKVLNVHIDPRAYWEYTNSPYDNERRAQAIAEHGVERGLDILAAATAE